MHWMIKLHLYDTITDVISTDISIIKNLFSYVDIIKSIKVSTIQNDIEPYSLATI